MLGKSLKALNVVKISLIAGLFFMMLVGLPLGFYFFRSQFVPRSCNPNADRLADLTKNRENQTWTNKATNCTLDVLSLDAGA